MMIVAIVLLVSTFISSLASYFLKKSTGKENKLLILLSPFFYLGGILYVVASGANIYLLQKLPYAIVLPLGSITYVWTMFLSNILLHEKITRRKILGMCIIIVGVVLVAYGRG